MNTKICYKCHEDKNVEDFYNNKQNSDNLDSYCKKCRYAYTASRTKIAWEQTKKNEEKDFVKRSKRLEIKKKSHRNHLINAMYNRAKYRSKNKGYSFNITLKDIIIPTYCPILKIPIIPGTKGNYRNTPTIDRVDNNKGYTKDNIQIISMLANTMKSSATEENLKSFVQFYYNKFKMKI